MVNRVSMCMDLKINSSQMFGSFEMGQMQPKLLVHKALRANGRLSFNKNLMLKNGNQLILNGGTKPFLEKK